jgi:hypothetical protein
MRAGASPVALHGRARTARPTHGKAEVDALDEQAVDEHLQAVLEQAGRVDISFDAAGIPNTTILGAPLVELALDVRRRHQTQKQALGRGTLSWERRPWGA